MKNFPLLEIDMGGGGQFWGEKNDTGHKKTYFKN